MTRRQAPKAALRTGRAGAARPLSKLGPGHVRCPCGASVGLTMRSRRLRAHRDPQGAECPLGGLPWGTTGTPDPETLAEATRMLTERLKRPLAEVDDVRRLPPTGRCHGCDRPVTGERRLCGSCAARRR